jgi:iron complex outermembrane receptor protein
LTYGVDVSQDNSSSFDRITDRSNPLATRTFFGVFLQSSFNVLDNLTLAGGVRYDVFNFEQNTGIENDASAVTFNVGTIYRFTNELSARVNFAQGFRPPTLLNLFGSDSEGAFFAPTRGRVLSDPELEPERANNIDIGVEYDSERFRVGLVYFRNDISDFQGFTGIVPPIPSRPPIATRVANKDVLLQGVEFSVGYLFNRNWAIVGNLTYVNSEDESGEPLSQLEVFPLTALIRLVYDDRRFTGYLQSRIYGGQGDVILLNNEVGEGSPPATVFDLSVGYRISPTTQVSLSVENLFDAEYIYPTVNFPAPGIRVLASLRAEF